MLCAWKGKAGDACFPNFNSAKQTKLNMSQIKRYTALRIFYMLISCKEDVHPKNSIFKICTLGAFWLKQNRCKRFLLYNLEWLKISSENGLSWNCINKFFFFYGIVYNLSLVWFCLLAYCYQLKKKTTKWHLQEMTYGNQLTRSLEHTPKHPQFWICKISFIRRWKLNVIVVQGDN